VHGFAHADASAAFTQRLPGERREYPMKMISRHTGPGGNGPYGQGLGGILLDINDSIIDAAAVIEDPKVLITMGGKTI
jgi:hypothetical protein